MLKYDSGAPAQTMSVLDARPVMDGRPRFRQIFCDVLTQQPDRLGRSCKDLLHRMVDEPGATETRSMAVHQPGLRVLFVPGLFSDCTRAFAVPFETAIPRLRALGYSARILQVSGRSSSAFNAKLIADVVVQEPANAGPLILVGHSKGAVDILEFLVTYPELAERVTAVVSVAGAINGSLLADFFAADYGRWLDKIALPTCVEGDGKALETLAYATRLDWLRNHRLPDQVRYFSLVAYTSVQGVSAPLRPFAAALAEVEPRNDGQLIHYDQIIPGATLLGYANADHWAVAVPIEERSPLVATFVTAHNYYPRDALAEAIVLYVAEALGLPEGPQ